MLTDKQAYNDVLDAITLLWGNCIANSGLGELQDQLMCEYWDIVSEHGSYNASKAELHDAKNTFIKYLKSNDSAGQSGNLIAEINDVFE